MNHSSQLPTSLHSKHSLIWWCLPKKKCKNKKPKQNKAKLKGSSVLIDIVWEPQSVSHCLALRRCSLPQESSLGLTSSGCQEQWPLKVWSLRLFFFFCFFTAQRWVVLTAAFRGKERDIPNLFFLHSDFTHPGTCPRVFFFLRDANNRKCDRNCRVEERGEDGRGSAAAICCCDVCFQANNLGAIFQTHS